MKNLISNKKSQIVILIIFSVVLVVWIGGMFSSGTSSATQNTPAPVLDSALATKRAQFDSTIGNNAEAASTASVFISTIKKSGTDVSMFLRLDSTPEAVTNFTNGGDLKSYRSSVTGAQLSIVIDGNVWSQLSDDTKKNTVATFVDSLHTLYPNAYQEVDVANNVRPLAKGTWSSWNNSPNVDLK